jgi:putative transposase
VVLLPAVPQRRHVEDDSRCAARQSAEEGREEEEPQRRDHRQPERQDDGKKGVCGYDAGKKINGRKRHIVVDTLGLLMAVVVHAANIQDREGAMLVLKLLRDTFPRLERIWADGGYAGQLIGWVAMTGGWILEIVKRTDKLPKFVVLPKRWIVERTFAWLGRYRRLSKDYELSVESSESMIYISMINLMLHRLAKG